MACIIDDIPNNTIQNAACAGRYDKSELLFEGYLSMLREESTIKVSSQKAEGSIRRSLKVDLRHSLSNTRNSKPYAKPDVSNIRCFNCKMKGHFQSKCPKPRINCTKCHLTRQNSVMLT